MAQYMVIETFLEQNSEKVYARFHAKGRMLPDGLIYLDSWLTEDGTRCFQLMETERFDLFEEWTKIWNDLVEFEIVKIGTKPANDEID